MIVTAWNNGKHHESGAGYGIKLSISDRDKYFMKEWKYVVLHFPDMTDGVKVNTDKDSFWNETCRELISKQIGEWLIGNGYAPWPKGSPLKFILEPVSDNEFRIIISS